MSNFESHYLDQAEINKPARMLEKPLIFGTEGERPEGRIYHRYAVTDDVGTLLNGLNVANLFSRSPGDRQTSGLYFSGYGRCSEVANVNVHPTDKWGIVEVDVSFDLDIMVDDLVKKGRFAIFIAMRITPNNFYIFRNRIREVAHFARGGRHHSLVLRGEYSELVGATAEINMVDLPPEQLSKMGSDLQVMIVDRDSRNHRYEFKRYSEVITDIREGKI